MHLFIVLFLSVLSSLLSTIYAAPYQHPLYRHITYNIQGKSAVTGKQLSDKEHTKSTVYRLGESSMLLWSSALQTRLICNLCCLPLDTWDNISNPGYVLKKYNTQSKTHVVNNEIYCLEAVGQLVAHDEDQKIIIMKEAEGETLMKVLTPFKGAEWKTKVNQWRTDVAKVVADIAEKNGVFNWWVPWITGLSPWHDNNCY